MTLSPAAAARSAPQSWSMTIDALDSLRADADRLAGDAVRRGGHITAYLTGEADAPTLMPNIDGQRLLRHLQDVRSALAIAHVETDSRLAVIGRRVTLEAADGSRTTYTLVIPGQGDPANGWVSTDSPLGRAVYGHDTGDEVRVDAPNGAWMTIIVTIE